MLVIPVNTSYFNHIFAQREHFQFGGQGGHNNIGQSSTVGCQTDAKNIVGSKCRTGSTDITSTDITNTQDSNNDVVITNHTASDSSSSNSSSLTEKTYIIQGQTTNSGGSPFTLTASCHNNDSILGGGYIYKIFEGKVISISSHPNTLSSFTTTVISYSSSDLAVSVQSYAICYDNP